MSSCPSIFECKVAFVTLGCAKNEVDTEKMKGRLSAAGYQLEDDVESADAIVVNTCSFIQSATEESLEAIFAAAGLPRVEQGSAALIVAGCMPARYGDQLDEELTEATCFVPCSKEDDIARVIADALGLDFDYDAMADGAAFEPIGSFSYVKISDGCDRFCSYCTIPFIRGRYHSFSYDDIHRDVEDHVEAGAREIVLIAQDTGRWGADFDGDYSLAWLMDSLAGEFSDIWFRVMYVQPEGVSDELLETIAAHDNICSYLDIPLQHVDPAILKAMNRRGSRNEFEQLFERIRNKVPDIVLRTTLIVGFPGETDEQFDELCEFVEDSPFDYIGVFPYSREEGTRAYDLPNQIDEEEKASRAQTLRDLADAVCTSRIAERVGKRYSVLVEGEEEDGQLFGRAQCQAPEVDGVVYLDEGEIGEFVDVVIGDTLLYEMESE